MTPTGAAESLDLAETLQFTRELVTEAAARALKMAQFGLAVDMKADGSVVTDVDRSIERFLRDAITARYPGHAILGEEFGFDGAAANVPLWALDPIDGTTNLANGLPQWCVSVGLVIEDTPVVGVVAAPVLGEIHSGARGLGAARNDAPLPPLSSGGPTGWEDTYAICSTSARVLRFDRVPARLRVLGSAALELCWTAAGRLCGCQSIGTSLYDVAAGVCFAGEVGAVTQWRDGARWSPMEMARQGASNRLLLTAPTATLTFLRENIGG